MRILVFHAGALGDAINLIPALRLLRNLEQSAAIVAVAKSPVFELFQAAGAIDEWMDLERREFAPLFVDAAPPDQLRRFLSAFGLAVSWIRSETLRRHLEREIPRVIQYPGPFPPPPGSLHACLEYARPLAELGLGDVTFPRLEFAADFFGFAPEFPGVLIHPGSGSRFKNWPADRFAQVARILRGKGVEVGALAGPADDESMRNFLKIAGDAVSRIFENLSLRELAGLLRNVQAVVSNDSGVAHLAGALGTPVVAVFGPTDHRVWGGRQPNTANLAPHLDCAPCPPDQMRDCRERRCLAAVNPDQVAEAAVIVSAQYPPLGREKEFLRG